MTKHILCVLCGFVTENKAAWNFRGLEICSACHEDLLALGVSPREFIKILRLHRPVMHHTPRRWLLVPCSDYEEGA